MNYTKNDIDKIMQEYVDTNEMAGGALAVHVKGETVYKNRWGYADALLKTPTEYHTLYRLMSMTKPVTAVAVMQLAEIGKLDIDAPLSSYIAGFSDQKVYEKQKEGADTVPIFRLVTIRDLLTHSSGMGMGIPGNLYVNKVLDIRDNLKERVKKWYGLPLDFQPGTATGYSPLVGFDVLGRVIESVSGMNLNEYFKANIFEPLHIKDMCFVPDSAQRAHVAKIYHTENGRLFPEPDLDSAPEMYQTVSSINASLAGYYSGSGGLWGSLEAYDRFAGMLLNEGTLDGVQILTPESVRMMRSEGAKKHLETDFFPGAVWGLGVLVFQQPQKGGFAVPRGTYGWSGAFGTHMFIAPQEKVSAVFMMNRYNIGGAASPIARKIEELVFGIW